MRISYILGFLLAFSLPAAAAEPDQNLKQEIGKIASAYEQYYDKQDAAGITSLYTKNYLRVASDGVVADNTKYYEGGFKAGFNHLEIKTTEVQPVSGDMAISTGEARITGKSEKGDPLDATFIWTALDVRENGRWKIRMLTSLPKPPPPPQQAANYWRMPLPERQPAGDAALAQLSPASLPGLVVYDGPKARERACQVGTEPQVSDPCVAKRR